MRQFKVASISNGINRWFAPNCHAWSSISNMSHTFHKKSKLLLNAKNCPKVYERNEKPAKETNKKWKSSKNCWIFPSFLSSSLSFKVTNGENNKLLCSTLHGKHRVFPSLILPLPSIVLTYQKLVKLSTIMMVAAEDRRKFANWKKKFALKRRAFWGELS